MGLNDQQSEGYWKWTDTSAPANFIKWAPGQPEGGRKQNCVVYSIHQAHRWHDADCHTKYSVICKQEIKKKLKQTKITDFFG
ncbi:C-type lectin-like isoform X2 [Ruditapes philippinarum]|uniref:C-type lectin-like isoform X2 n=1 Tax=Ruditapes philippinarum TaxID=129788 RepID=UPI00295AB98C|nr:C-type lectin-like isoform X2 [Ruditapes philippinarum]